MFASLTQAAPSGGVNPLQIPVGKGFWCFGQPSQRCLCRIERIAKSAIGCLVVLEIIAKWGITNNGDVELKSHIYSILLLEDRIN
jgi:hypothetical protein